MHKKRVTKIVQSLDALNTKDIYSLLLFILYKMHDIPQYSTLSELSYILDGNNLNKLLTYYGGMTIRIPTLREMNLLVKALTLYQYVNLEDQDFTEALSAVASVGEFSEEELKDAYSNILQVISQYDFGEENVG